MTSPPKNDARKNLSNGETGEDANKIKRLEISTQAFVEQTRRTFKVGASDADVMTKGTCLKEATPHILNTSPIWGAQAEVPQQDLQGEARRKAGPQTALAFFVPLLFAQAFLGHENWGQQKVDWGFAAPRRAL